MRWEFMAFTLNSADHKFLKMKEQMSSAGVREQIMILNCTAYPIYSLVQGDQGTKAMCTALKDIDWFSGFEFPALSGQASPVKMMVISMETQHGWSATSCRFSVEVKFQDYSRQEVLKTIRQYTFCELLVQPNSQSTESAA